MVSKCLEVRWMEEGEGWITSRKQLKRAFIGIDWFKLERRKRTMNFHLNILSIRNMLKSNSLLFCSRWNQQKRNFPIDKAFARNSINLKSNFLVNLRYNSDKCFKLSRIQSSLSYHKNFVMEDIHSVASSSFPSSQDFSVRALVFNSTSTQMHRAEQWDAGKWWTFLLHSGSLASCSIHYASASDRWWRRRCDVFHSFALKLPN